MKLLTDRLTALARSITGVKAEAQDAELILRPNLYAFTELPSPIRRAGTGPAETATESFAYTLAYGITGAAAGGNTDGPTLAPGLWHFRGWARYQFSGTANFVPFGAYGLIDPPGNNLWFLRVRNGGPLPLNVTVNIDQLISLIDPGWFIRQVAPATIAGDIINQEFQIVGSKLV